MMERGWIELIVERVVGEVLESHATQVRTEIVCRVMDEIAAEPRLDEATPDQPGLSTLTPTEPIQDNASSADLARAVAEIQLGTSQREILSALLDASARYATRVALFVVKGSHAKGWQGRGFTNGDALKDFALDENAAAVNRAICDRAGVTAPFAEMDARFLDEFGTPARGEARILPLILKDKVAALVYADSGTDVAGWVDAGSLELLVLSTGAWLEVNSLRKQGHKEPSAAHADDHGTAAVDAPTDLTPAHAAPAFNDPFVSHTPGFAGPAKAKAAAAPGDGMAMAISTDVEAPTMAAPMSIAESQSANAEGRFAATAVQSSIAAMEPALSEPQQMGHAESMSEHEAEPAPSLSPEDRDLHGKAQRFARLLVDEIKLYNQATVAQGRQNKDLYDRLQEEIEKSRATYQKRYGNTVAGPANYFEHEIIGSLAEDDPSLMGANFRQ
jgi:hypothetical protein